MNKQITEFKNAFIWGLSKESTMLITEFNYVSEDHRLLSTHKVIVIPFIQTFTKTQLNQPENWPMTKITLNRH